MKHVNPSSDARTAKAPYNFVPLPDQVLSVADGVEVAGVRRKPWLEQHGYVPGAHTGWIDLAIQAEQPLYVRCAPRSEQAAREDLTLDAAEAHRKYRHRQDFFHHGDPNWPVIPGSTLRGAIRSLVEILGYGKLGRFSDRTLFYRAVADKSALGDHYRGRMQGRIRAGYLEKTREGWAIRPAIHDDRIRTNFVWVAYHAVDGAGPHKPRQPYDRKRDLLPVRLNLEGLKPDDTGVRLKKDAVDRLAVGGDLPPGWTRAVLVRSGHVPEKNWHCAVLPPDPSAPLIPIPQATWERYEQDASMPRTPFHIRPLEDGDPLFYLLDQDGRLIFFGHTAMFRLPYAEGSGQERTVARLVPAAVRSPDLLDLAEAIFGRTEPQPAFRGRVSFTDAPWEGGEGEPFLPGEGGLRSPGVLGTPRPTAFQHYLVQQGDERKNLRHWDSAPGATQIRGHKRYWHRKGTDPFEAALRTESNMHTVIRPVRAGTRFRGRVYFENLSDLELGALLTALDLPAGKRHQIGVGKPRGMGACRITARVHLVDPVARYSSLFGHGDAQPGEQPAAVVDFVVRQAGEVFRRTVVAHHNRSVPSEPVPEGADLWRIPRLEALGCLLEWEQAPDPARTAYMPGPGEEKGAGPRWRDRPVLPDPLAVAGRPTVGAPQKVPAPVPSGGGPDGPGPYRIGARISCTLKKHHSGTWQAVHESGRMVVLEGDIPQGVRSGAKVELEVIKEAGVAVHVRWPGPKVSGPRKTK